MHEGVNGAAEVDDHKREFPLTIRLTKGESIRLKEDAGLCGKSKSELARERLLGVRSRPDRKPMPRDLLPLYGSALEVVTEVNRILAKREAEFLEAVSDELNLLKCTAQELQQKVLQAVG